MSSGGQQELRYWEDLVVGGAVDCGPYEITADELTRFLALSHERGYPVHTDDSFASQTKVGKRVIPGTFVHSVVVGRIGQVLGYTAVVCVRWAHYDYIRPLYPGQQFRVRSKVLSKEPVDDRYGIAETCNQVLGDEPDSVFTVGRINTLLLRRDGAL